MTTAPVIAQVTSAVTLEDLLAFSHTPLAQLDSICHGLTSLVDQARFQSLRNRIDVVVGAVRPAGSTDTKKQWESRKSVLKGKLFEQLVGLILDSAVIFDNYHHIQTLTNEIDWLVIFAPMRFLVPAMGSWGAHFLCECKMTKKALDTNWVSRLNTLLQTQAASVAVIFTATEAGNKGNSGRTLRLIEDLSIGANRFIIRVSMDELQMCASMQRNLLHLLSEKFLQLRVRSDKLKLIAN